MTEPLPRDDVIRLLNGLGSDRDEDVLEAARELHARITAAGTAWENLLVPDDGGAENAEDAESPDLEDDSAEANAEASATDAESIALIDKLLARSDISTDLREELKDYKTDIAAGEFEDRDRHYLQAVHKRLSKRR